MTFKKFFATSVLVTLVAATSAQATGGCDFFDPGGPNTGPQPTSPNFRSGTAFTVVAGDKTTVNFDAGAGQTGQVQLGYFSPANISRTPDTIIASCATTGTQTCSVTGVAPSDGLLEVSIRYLTAATPAVAGSFTVSCSPGGATALELDLAKQSFYATIFGRFNWLSSSYGRRGGLGTTGRGLNFSSRGLGDEGRPTNFWLTLEGAKFDGHSSTNGSGYIFGGGIDYAFGSSLLGAALSYEKSKVESGATQIETKGLSFGPYFETKFSNGTELFASLAYGRPDVTYAAGATAKADTWSGQFRLTGSYELGSTRAQPYLDVSGFDISIDPVGTFAPREIDYVTVGTGSRFDFAPVNAYALWLEVGVSGYKSHDSVGPDDSGFTGRLGAGVSRELENGKLSLGFDIQQITTSFWQYTLSLGYSSRF